MSEFIKIVKYQESWPSEFLKEKEKLVSYLGNLYVGIHHIGSTAVPGLAGKPIIDIAMEINNYPPGGDLITALEYLGYEYRGEGNAADRHWFAKGSPRKFNLHVVPSQGDALKRQLAFRDFLRKNHRKAKEYVEIKLANAAGKDIDSYEYALSKSRFIEEALSREV